jgi:hypothetical protein
MDLTMAEMISKPVANHCLVSCQMSTAFSPFPNGQSSHFSTFGEPPCPASLNRFISFGRRP